MDFITWAISPWGRSVPIHIAWYLIWIAVIAGLLFMIVHALYVAIFAAPKKFTKNDSPAVLAAVPERVPRHSLVARAFHWLMAISMLASIIFHIIHASFFLDFWSIWPDKIDLRDAKRRLLRSIGKEAPPPDRFAKYPLENKLYHAVILLSGLAVIVTGVFMMKRVNTAGIFTRNPYLFGDMTWGMMYVLHGLAGVGLIALIMVHVLHEPRFLSRRTRSKAMGSRRVIATSERVCTKRCRLTFRNVATQLRRATNSRFPMLHRDFPAMRVPHRASSSAST